MQNVFKFIGSYWSLLIGFFVILLVVFGCNKLLVSCNNNVQAISKNISLQREENNIKQIENLLSKVESLEKKDSIFQESIKKIDSLRSDLHIVKLRVAEQYGFLSSRYPIQNTKR